MTICHDRLPTQAIAVKRAIQITETIDKKFSLVVDVPCMNHILHNNHVNGTFLG